MIKDLIFFFFFTWVLFLSSFCAYQSDKLVDFRINNSEDWHKNYNNSLQAFIPEVIGPVSPIEKKSMKYKTIMHYSGGWY